MKVYLSNPYGTIPGENWRDYRFFLLAKTLADEGHEVVWFTSTFSHHFKLQRSAVSQSILINSNLRIHLVKSSSYKYNFSFGRILRDLTYGIRLTSILKHDFDKPDLFFNGDSPLLFYFPSYWFCRRNKIPYVIDQMDMWPELIINAFPKYVRPIINICCFPIYVMRKKVFNDSCGFISLAKNYLDIPKSISQKIAQIPNAVVYNGIDVDIFRSNMLKFDDSLQKKLGNKREGDIWFVFAGTLGPSYDLKTLLKGFLNFQNDKCRLIIAGDGSNRRFVEDFIINNNLKNVIYIGQISKDLLPYLYSKCDIGLNAYGPFSNVEMSDKFYDYTAAGLAILNSLGGEVNQLVIGNVIGLNYKGGDLDSFCKVLNEITEDNSRLSVFKLNSYKLGTLFDQKVQLKIFSNFVKDICNKVINKNNYKNEIQDS